MYSLAEISDRLRQRPVVRVEPGERSQAAVALVLCDEGSGPEVLFIERTEQEQDPWSGHLGFPGGRVEPIDGGLRDTAVRETREETDLDLSGAEYLGCLDDLCSAHFPVVISCYVFGMRHRPALTLNEAEVADAFWYPLENLPDPRLRREKIFPFLGEEQTHPALQILDADRPYLWGITYRLICRFLEVLGRPL